MKPRRVHGWIPHYRAPTNHNTIDPSWTSLLAEYRMRMGDTICGQDERRRVVARYRGEHVTCPVCRKLIAAMIVRAFRVLAGLPTDGDWLWGCTPGPTDTPP
jgi:hypothetical protein